MNRRTFVIEPGKAFPVVIGALYIAGCDTHDAGIPASDQHKPADFTFIGKKS